MIENERLYPVSEELFNRKILPVIEVTQKEWTEVMGSNPSNFNGTALPVEQVDWYDAISYCNKRSVKEGLTPAYTINGQNVTWDKSVDGYRLLTEAEWEYAARGGKNSSTQFTYAGSNTVGDVAWYSENSGNRTHEAGQKAPNALGLYDMSGNVWEMVLGLVRRLFRRSENRSFRCGYRRKPYPTGRALLRWRRCYACGIPGLKRTVIQIQQYWIACRSSPQIGLYFVTIWKSHNSHQIYG
jgi:formylglycine-generating enzyme required for sulfatase activity